jgi:hypothetical protein
LASNFKALKTFFTFSFVYVVVSCSAPKEDDSVVLARVNEQTLTVQNLEKLLPFKNRTSVRVRNFIHDWVDDALFYDAAKKNGLLQDKALQDARDQYYKKIIIGSFLQTKTINETVVSNDEIREYYDFTSEIFVRSSDGAFIHHFLTNKHSEALAIRTALRKKRLGKKYDELFTNFNVENKTVVKGQMIKELGAAVFKSKKLAVVGPIKTKNGYHIIDVVKRFKKGSKMSLEDVYDEIYQRLIKQKQVKESSGLLDSLKKQSNVFINSNYQ